MAKLSVSVTPMRRSASSRSENRRLLGVVGLRRIAGRRPDAAIFSVDQLLAGKLFVRRIGPEFAPHALVHPLGKSFGDAVGQRLHQDRAIIVIGLGEALRDLLLPRRRR